MFFSVFLLSPTGKFLIFLFPCLFSLFTFVPHINLSVLSHLPPSFDPCFLPLLFTTFLPPYRCSLYLSMINFVPLSFFYLCISSSFIRSLPPMVGPFISSPLYRHAPSACLLNGCPRTRRWMGLNSSLAVFHHARTPSSSRVPLLCTHTHTHLPHIWCRNLARVNIVERN